MDDRSTISGPQICLQDAMQTFAQRGKQYGGNSGEAYKRFGHIMMALFPNGLTINSPEDWNRYGCFHMEVVKIARYAANFEVGHIDSQHDLIVYASMLESLDREAQLQRQKQADDMWSNL
jgi:hypothetical protein